MGSRALPDWSGGRIGPASNFKVLVFEKPDKEGKWVLIYVFLFDDPWLAFSHGGGDELVQIRDSSGYYGSGDHDDFLFAADYECVTRFSEGPCAVRLWALLMHTLHVELRFYFLPFLVFDRSRCGSS